MCIFIFLSILGEISETTLVLTWNITRISIGLEIWMSNMWAIQFGKVFSVIKQKSQMTEIRFNWYIYIMKPTIISHASHPEFQKRSELYLKTVLKYIKTMKSVINTYMSSTGSFVCIFNSSKPILRKHLKKSWYIRETREGSLLCLLSFEWTACEPFSSEGLPCNKEKSQTEWFKWHNLQ